MGVGLDYCGDGCRSFQGLEHPSRSSYHTCVDLTLRVETETSQAQWSGCVSGWTEGWGWDVLRRCVWWTFQGLVLTVVTVSKNAERAGTGAKRAVPSCPDTFHATRHIILHPTISSVEKIKKRWRLALWKAIHCRLFGALRPLTRKRMLHGTTDDWSH
jgi:predicted secreted protein